MLEGMKVNMIYAVEIISPMIALLRLLKQCDNSDYDHVDEYGDDDNDDMTQ